MQAKAGNEIRETSFQPKGSANACGVRRSSANQRRFCEMLATFWQSLAETGIRRGLLQRFCEDRQGDETLAKQGADHFHFDLNTGHNLRRSDGFCLAPPNRRNLWACEDA